MIFDVFNLLNYYHNHIFITAPNLHPQELTYWKRPWCWKRLKAGGEGDNRGWDGWMASLTWWTWLWPSSRSWWWTGRPGVLQSMGSQRVGHKWAMELTNLGGFIFECHIFLLFHTVCEVLKARIQNWFGIPSSSEPRFVRTLHHDPSILGGPAWHGSQIHWVIQGCDPHDHFS